MSINKNAKRNAIIDTLITATFQGLDAHAVIDGHQVRLLSNPLFAQDGLLHYLLFIDAKDALQPAMFASHRGFAPRMRSLLRGLKAGKRTIHEYESGQVLLAKR